MVRADEELADKIYYLKDYGFMPNIENEEYEFQLAILTFYYLDEMFISKTKCDPYWFRLMITNYHVTDGFVHEIDRELKRLEILNIGKSEFGPNVN